MEKIRIYYKKWSELNPFAFVVVTTFLSFLLMIPMVIALVYFDVQEDELGTIKRGDSSHFGFFIFIVVAAPIFETFFSQSLIIKLTQKLFKNRYHLLTVIISAVLFAYLHLGHSNWYPFMIFPLGLLLAETYIVFQKRKESSFWMTTAVHALRNLIGYISIVLGE
jgi:membrane protease YdiL (CAAX protease family)